MVSKSRNPLGLLIRLYLIFLIMLGLSRLLLTLWQWHEVPAGSLGYIMLQGLRVDFATLCLLSAPMALIIIPCLFLAKVPKLITQGLRIYASLCAALLTLNELATPAFINEYGLRPNHIYIDYLIYPAEVGRTLLHGHLLASLITIAGTLLALVITFILVGRYTRHGLKGMPPLKAVSAVILLLVILPLGARSTLGHRPLNPAMVSFSDSQLANSLPVNSTYSALYALTHRDYQLSSSEIYSIEPKEASIKAAAQFAARESEAVVNTLCPLNQAITPALTHAQRPNLVIILEESMGADFVKSLGGLDLTPELEQLKASGWWFDHMYAAGHRSVRGIEAVTAGFPPNPLDSIVKLPQRPEAYATIFNILKHQGYQTSFIYGGESHFDNMRTYFLNNGMNKVIEQKDYVNPGFTASWGVSDEDLFNRANLEFKQSAAAGKPFASVVFSSSFHDPFEIPEGKVSLPAGLQTDEPKRLLAVKYADYALGRFFAQARQEEYFKNTIFLVIADHESRVRGAKIFPLHNFEIPALIIGPGIGPKLDQRRVSQIDMLPTLLSLTGFSGNIPAVGSDLNRQDLKSRAIVQLNNDFGYLKQDAFTVLSPQGQAAAFKLEGRSTLIPSKLDPKLVQEGAALENLGPYAYSNDWLSIKCVDPKSEIKTKSNL